jgi:hypothetical protein
MNNFSDPGKLSQCLLADQHEGAEIQLKFLNLVYIPTRQKPTAVNGT